MENIYSNIQSIEDTTSDLYMKGVVVFRDLYWHLQDVGLTHFGDDGKVFGFDGEFILQEAIWFYESREEYMKCHFFQGLLTKLRERMKAHSENIGRKNTASAITREYKLALPKSSRR